MSGIYLKCRTCNLYRPRREFRPNHNGHCRVCDPPASAKRCLACGFDKPIGEFHVDRHSRDGRRNECMLCRNDGKRREWHRRKRAGRNHERFNDDHVQRLIVSSWA